MAITQVLLFFLQVEAIILSLRPPLPMKRKRKIIAIVLSALFLAYFSASFIFVPEAAGLKDQDTSIVRLENHDHNLDQGLLRSSSSEHAEDALNFFNDETVSFLQDVHTSQQLNQLLVQKNSQFHSFDIYLSLRRLRI